MKIAFNPSTVAALTTPPNNKDITFDLRGQNIFARGVKFYGTDTNTWRDIKINNVSIGSNILDLRNGSNTTLTNTDGVVIINSTWRPVVDNLTSDSTTSSLSAKQGKVLKALLNSKLSVYELAYNTNVGTIKNNGIYYSTTDASSKTLINSPFNTGFAFINMTSYDGGDDLRRSRLAFNVFGEIKVSDDRDQANTAETWYNVLTSKNSGINGSTIKLNGTSITVYSSGTADGRYVKKSGDTMSGVLTIDTTNFGALTIKRNDDANGASIQFRGKSSVYGYIGLNNSTKDKQFLRWSSDTSRIYTILDTSSTYISNGKGVINGTTITQVDNATNSTNSTNARKLVNWYSARPTSLNAQFGDGSLRIFYATSSTTEGKPAEDSHILHLAWDNTDGLDAQLAVHTRSGKVSTRAQNGGTWQPWKTLAFTTDIPSSLKNPYALTISLNGTSQGPYDGSAAKNINITPGSIGAAVSNHSHDYLVVNSADDKSFNSAYHNFQVLYADGGNGITGKPANVDAFGLFKFRAASGWSGQMLLANGGSLYIRSSEDAKMTNTLSWKTILDSSNYSSILNSRYYTESEVNSLLNTKLNRQNLSYSNWNPRGWNLAADYYYNGGNISIAENNGKMYISVDGCFWQNEGQYKVLDTSDISNIQGSLTLSQYLSATDDGWFPLVWGGSTHLNTSDSTGPVYKSYDKLSWQTSSQTLQATNIQTNNIKNLSVGGGIYWNPYAESNTDNTDVASITLDRQGVAGGTTLIISQMNDAIDTIQFKTHTDSRLYHNSYPILTTQNTYVSNNKGYINGLEITQVNNADTTDGYHATDGRTFNGNINWGSWNNTWSDGTHTHPWYGFDHRYPNTGAYSTTISDYAGMTIKSNNTLLLDCGTLLLNSRNNVGIGTSVPSYKLDVNGQMRASGFHHSSVNSNDYMLLAGGGYKSFGGDYSTPIFLGCLNLYHGNDGTISSSFYCLGYSVSFTYTRGGNYCKIIIPDTAHLSFYTTAAIASVNYSGGGMDTWVGDHRGQGAWWLHCYVEGRNEVRVKGFHPANSHNDSWWGGNPLYSDNGGANKITVCIFGHVTYK